MSEPAAAEQLMLAVPLAGFTTIEVDLANRLLVAWGHELGPVHRPFGMQAWLLDIAGEPISVAVSASAVSATVAGYSRGEVVELARLCSASRWANRVMLRLWREVAAQRWPYWPVAAAVSYSLNSRHDGQLYRFDGWEKITDSAGSSGGGAWSRKRYATDAVHGKKTLWLWRFGPVGSVQAQGEDSSDE